MPMQSVIPMQKLSEQDEDENHDNNRLSDLFERLGEWEQLHHVKNQ